jgi:hypothetical protein
MPHGLGVPQNTRLTMAKAVTSGRLPILTLRNASIAFPRNRELPCRVSVSPAPKLTWKEAHEMRSGFLN